MGRMKYYCNFCGMGPHTEDSGIFVMLKGPDVHICNSCIETMSEIVAEARGNIEYASWGFSHQETRNTDG